LVSIGHLDASLALGGLVMDAVGELEHIGLSGAGELAGSDVPGGRRGEGTITRQRLCDGDVEHLDGLATVSGNANAVLVGNVVSDNAEKVGVGQSLDSLAVLANELVTLGHVEGVT